MSFHAVEPETRRQRTAQTSKTRQRLFFAGVACNPELTCAGDPNLDPVTLFEIEGIDHGRRESNGQAFSPLADVELHQYIFTLSNSSHALRCAPAEISNSSARASLRVHGPAPSAPRLRSANGIRTVRHSAVTENGAA